MRRYLQLLLGLGLWTVAWGSFAQSPELSSDQSASATLSFSAALQLAEHQSPSLVAQAASIRAAQSSAIPAAALPDPKLIIGADNVPISGADRGNFNRDFMTMEKIGVMQDVPNGDKRHARADIAAAQVAKAQAEQQIERLKVRQATAIAWLDRLYLERRLALLSELDHENKMLDDSVRAQLSTGKGAAADALMPKLEAADLADRRDELLQAIAQAKAVLRRWIGDDAYLPLTGEAPVLTIDPQQLHAHLHRHPELAAFGSMTDLAQAEIREAEADKKSDWGIELNYQRRSALYSDMVSLQFTYDLPVFSSTRQTPRVEAKRHALEQLDAEQQAMLREHTAELESNLAQYTTLNQQLKRTQATRLPIAQQKVDLQMASYRAGRGDLNTVLIARREAIETRLREIELQSQQATLAAKLYFSYGENTLAENAQ